MTTALSASEHINAIHQRCCDLLNPPRDPDAIAKLDASVDRQFEKQIDDPEHERHGGWTEEYGPDKALYTGGGNMFYSLLAMARAWMTPGSRHHHSDEL